MKCLMYESRIQSACQGVLHAKSVRLCLSFFLVLLTLTLCIIFCDDHSSPIVAAVRLAGPMLASGCLLIQSVNGTVNGSLVGSILAPVSACASGRVLKQYESQGLDAMFMSWFACVCSSPGSGFVSCLIASDRAACARRF